MSIYNNILLCVCVIKLKYNMKLSELGIQLSLSDGSSSDMLPSPITLRNLVLSFTFSFIHLLSFGQDIEFNGLSDIFGKLE